MSRLEQLIEELCPEGVEFRKIKDAYKRLKGTPVTARKMKEIDNPDGNIRIFAGGKTAISAFEKDIPKANITRVPAVLVQSRGVIDAIYYEEPFTFKNEMWAYTTEDKTSVKYLYYVLKNNIQQFRDAASGMGSLPQISLRVTEDFSVPIPPLPIQEEIVRILDHFTKLTRELTTELTTEATARQKQYEYYRDLLLTFDDSVPTQNLGEVCHFQNGFAFQSSKFRNKGKPILRIANIQNNSIDGDDVAYFEDDDYRENLERYLVKKGDIVVAMSGATTGKIGINKTETTFYLNQRVGRFDSDETRLKRQYLYHFLLSKSQEIYALAGGGAQPNLSTTRINSIPIPIPPLSEQQHIVDILDRFDGLVNDLTSGLPAEIEARRKQYEYYRDKLLTFKEATP